MNILISGASVGGPTLAYWLVRAGFRVTVVERAAGPREGGYPIDLRSTALEVIERMGLLPQVLAARVEMAEMSFVDAAGRRRGGVNTQALRRAMPGREVELPRGDLVRILYEASRNDVEYVFGDSIKELTQDDDGATVAFESGGSRRFDLVIGADGLHSATRRLAFGEESQFFHHLGYCVAAADVPQSPGQRNDSVQLYNAPGRMAGVYSYLDRATAIFVFRHPEAPRDVERQKKALVEAFAGESSWRVPELLAHVVAAPDFYFDSVAQIRMPRWSRGRVALVGDAVHCPALLSGQGTSLAVLGAYTLAGELRSAAGDHAGAFARYEAEHRRTAEEGQQKAIGGARQLVPDSSLAIWARNQASHLWVVAAAGGPLLSRLSRGALPLKGYDFPSTSAQRS